MSKARYSDDDALSLDSLRALFQRQTEGQESHTAEDVWDAMLNNGWLRADVMRRALCFVDTVNLAKDLADDLAQQALLDFLQKLKSDPTLHANPAKITGSFEGWLCKMIRRSFIDTAKKQYPDLPANVMATAENVLSDVDEDSLTRAERFSKVQAALKKLPAKERSAILMDLDGKKHTDIARILGVTYKQLIAILRRAESKLRKWLSDYRYED